MQHGPGEPPVAPGRREPPAVDGARHGQAEERERADGPAIRAGSDRRRPGTPVEGRGARGHEHRRTTRARPACSTVRIGRHPSQVEPLLGDQPAAGGHERRAGPTSSRSPTRRTPASARRAWVSVHAIAERDGVRRRAATSAGAPTRSARRRAASPTSVAGGRPIGPPVVARAFVPTVRRERQCSCPTAAFSRCPRLPYHADRPAEAPSRRREPHNALRGARSRGLPRRVTVSAICGGVNT